jgi:fatty-acid desaturase
MRSTQLADERPWTRPWWQASEGNGPVLFYIVAIHILAVVGLILFPLPGWRLLGLALAVTTMGGIGTTVYYHRCLAHRAVRLNPIVEGILIFFTVFNASGEPITWVANHRNHHAKADTAEDVSSPRHGGFWWAHIRWVYQWSGSDARRWCPDLDKPVYRIWQRLQVPIVTVSVCLGLVLGWQAFFWLGPIRLLYSLHFQMLVNSLLHMSPELVEGEDSSRNIWWLGPLQLGAWGENWHRNHHTDANCARFGRKWYQIDLGWYLICGLESLGLATDVGPGRERIRERARAAVKP